jgi:uncharacterized protein YcbX
MSVDSSVGRLAGLYRYPVKSLTGEVLTSAEVERRGLAGDRLWSLRDPDGKFGSGKSSRRFRAMPGLMNLVARYDGDVPVIELPDGTVVRGDDPAVHEAMSAYVGRPVTLGREDGVSHFDDGPVHLVTTASLATLSRHHGQEVDVRRFRPNLLIDTGEAGLERGFVEQDWLGRRVAVGDVLLEVIQPMPRCVMVTQAQRDLPPDDALLRRVTDVADLDFGVLAEVVTPGRVAVGDPVSLRTTAA